MVRLVRSLALLAWVAAVRFAPGATLGDRPFQSLSTGQHLRVSYTATGCFLHDVYDFDFHRGKDLVVEVLETVDIFEFGGLGVKCRQRVSLGALHLSRKDAEGLDRLIACYRNGPFYSPATASLNISVTSRLGTEQVTEEFTKEAAAATGENGVVSFSELAHRLTSRYPPLAEIEEELRPQALQAQRACSEMSGLELLNDVFRFESAYILEPKTLSVRLRSVTDRLIDTVSWNDPMKGGKGLLDWHDFMGIYRRADSTLSKHEWLVAWKKLYGIRTLELQLVGARVDRSSVEYITHVLPLWEHAKFSGTPTYCLRARHGAEAWIEIYFSDQDDRALIYRAAPFDDDPYGDLDKLELSWLPDAKEKVPHAKYAVVSKDGVCLVETFGGSAP